MGSCPGKSSVPGDRARKGCRPLSLPEHRFSYTLSTGHPLLHWTFSQVVEADSWRSHLCAKPSHRRLLPGPPHSPRVAPSALCLPSHSSDLILNYTVSDLPSVSPPGLEALGGQDHVSLAHCHILGTQPRPWNLGCLTIC